MSQGSNSPSDVAEPGVETSQEVLKQCTQRLLNRLPPEWSAELSYEKWLGSRSIDLLMTVTSPDGTPVSLVIEASRLVARRDVGPIAEALAEATAVIPNSVGVVMARYLAPSVREALETRKLSYVDATGNMRVSASRPGLFLKETGSDGDPWRGAGRPRGTLKGQPASRVVRTLLDSPGSWRVRDLVAASGASTGATYRVLDFLESEELVKRDPRGAVTVPSWRPLLERWSRDYGFLRSNTVRTYIEPRGLPKFLEKIASTDGIAYAITGSVAASEWAPYAPARAAMIYVESADDAAKAWGLRPTTTGTNVLLAEPESEVVFRRSLTAATGLVLAAPTQVAVDLMTGPGRNPEEARDLIEWMERNESSWR
ncbi:MAG: hypothetical protein ACOH10_11625 [Rhodoglobus sp.]